MFSLKLLALLLVPSLLWGLYHYYKDIHKPEPWRWLLAAFGLGVGAGWLTGQVYWWLSQLGLRHSAYSLAAEGDTVGLLAYSVLAIGIIEELLKFIPFWFLIRRIDHFDEPVDALVYASFIALGVAAHENYWYLTTLSNWEAIGRAIASPGVHIAFASIWAYPIGWAHAHGRSEAKFAVLGLALAALTHGVYDFFVIGFPLWAKVIPPVMIGAILMWHMRAMCLLAEHDPSSSAKSAL